MNLFLFLDFNLQHWIRLDSLEMKLCSLFYEVIIILVTSLVG
jgi:hypothetical protein